MVIYVSNLGGVAQLGECLTGSQKVMGSIPTVSTNNKHSSFEECLLFFYDKGIEKGGFVKHKENRNRP